MPQDIHRIIDGHIAMWHAQRQVPDAASSSERVKRDRPRPMVVAIANQIGANGRRIGVKVAERLGIPTYDREIMQHIADTAHVSVATVETLDEHARSRVDEYLTALLREQTFNVNDHLRLLTRIVVALWEHGPCVFTGHGCIHIVPRDHALMVRIVAPLKLRIERVAESGHYDTDEARRRVLAGDADPEAFHRRYFRAAVDDLQLYDLAVNSGQLDNDSCADMIAGAYRSRFKAT